MMTRPANQEGMPTIDAESDLIRAIPSPEGGGTHLPKWMGVQLKLAAPGEVEGLLPSRPEIMNYRGIFHGGAVSTLADVSMISAVKSQSPEDSLPVTASLQVQFLSPGREYLTSRAQVVRIGGGLGFATVKISDASGRDVAVGSGVFRILVR